MYKGFAEASPEGYAAKEFDKLAPSPGVDWQGRPQDWPELAVRHGWRVETVPTAAKTGAIIIAVDRTGRVLAGIIRAVNDTGICFETLGPHKQSMQTTVEYHSLENDYKLIGYVWPEHAALRKRLVIGPE